MFNFARAARQLAKVGQRTLLAPSAANLLNGPLPAAACATQRLGFATNSHDVLNVHMPASHNNWETEFDFTPANYKRAEEIMSRYPSNYKASALIPLLDLAQQQNEGWLTLAAMNRVASVLEMAPIRVYEVATFYTMFNRSKMGKYHVMVCGTTPCMLQGAEGIYQAVSSHLGVGYGGTTQDGLFTLSEMECMGACVNAPMIAVADYTKGVEGFSYIFYEDLTPSDAVGILDALRSGKSPRPNSQHRRGPEPAGAIVGDRWIASRPEPVNLTLQGEPSGPFCRNLDEDEQAPPLQK